MTKQSQVLRSLQLQIQEPGLVSSIYFFPAYLQMSSLKPFFGERKAHPPRLQPTHTLLHTQWKPIFLQSSRCKLLSHSHEDTCRAWKGGQALDQPACSVTGCVSSTHTLRWEQLPPLWRGDPQLPEAQPSPCPCRPCSKAGTGDDPSGTTSEPSGKCSPGCQASGCWVDPAGKPWSPVFSFGASRPLHEQGNALAYRAPNAQSIKWKSPDLSKTDPASSPSSATAV